VSAGQVEESRSFNVTRGDRGSTSGLLRRWLETVLDQEIHVVALVEDPALHPRVKLLQAARFAVLLRDELLIQRCDLDVAVERWKVEVRREALGSVAVAIPLDIERGRLVLPLDLIEIEQLRELLLAVVSEPNALVGKESLDRQIFADR
jgi:hypothetical protein